MTQDNPTRNADDSGACHIVGWEWEAFEVGITIGRSKTTTRLGVHCVEARFTQYTFDFFASPQISGHIRHKTVIAMSPRPQERLRRLDPQG